MYKGILSVLVTASIVFVFAGCEKKENGVVEKATEAAVAIEEKVAEVVGANDSDSDHSAENALDWNGVYKGVLPCADCEGIETQIELDFNNTFVYKAKYLGKGDDAGYSVNGTLSWINGGTIVLNMQPTATFFKVGENYLEVLDTEGNEIKTDANLVLEKIPEE